MLLMSTGNRRFALGAIVASLMLVSCGSVAPEPRAGSVSKEPAHCSDSQMHAGPVTLTPDMNWYELTQWESPSDKPASESNQTVSGTAEMRKLGTSEAERQTLYAHSRFADEMQAALNGESHVIVGVKRNDAFLEPYDPYVYFLTTAASTNSPAEFPMLCNWQFSSPANKVMGRPLVFADFDELAAKGTASELWTALHRPPATTTTEPFVGPTDNYPALRNLAGQSELEPPDPYLKTLQPVILTIELPANWLKDDEAICSAVPKGPNRRTVFAGCASLSK